MHLFSFLPTLSFSFMAAIFFCPSPPNQSSTMAVNLCQDICSSPRISFSYILDHYPSSDYVARSDQNLSVDDSDLDFKFCFPNCELANQISPADELFFNGVIIPKHIKQTNPIPSLSVESSSREKEEEIIVTSSTKASLIREEKVHSKSFWRFMRSSSVNCESSHCKKASIWSSLPLLVRSYSTGSKQGSHGKLHSGSSNHRQSSKSNGLHQKPPLKKAQFGTNGNSSTVLNVPPPYITKGTSDLLGFRSLFSHGNDKKGKKP